MTTTEVFSAAKASLGLAPVTPGELVAAEQLHRYCDQLALSAAAIEHRSHEYYVGERFLELVNFMGCSPHIRLDDEDAGDFTRIILHQLPQAGLFHGKHTRPPLCPACAKPVANWQDQGWQQDARLVCGSCGERVDMACCNWRRGAAMAASVIEISDVFPREALPQPTLLAKLGDLTGSEWHYFYF